MTKPVVALCLSLSFIAGIATATLAQGTIAGTYWYSGDALMSYSRTIRSAYAAGAHDMLAAVMELANDRDPTAAANRLVAADACLDRRSAGKLSEFTDWAESLWRGRRESAAKIMLLEACR